MVVVVVCSVFLSLMVALIAVAKREKKNYFVLQSTHESDIEPDRRTT